MGLLRVGLLLILLVIAMVVGLLLARSARGAVSSRNRRDKAGYAVDDPWRESGRRLFDPPGDDDETVDFDLHPRGGPS